MRVNLACVNQSGHCCIASLVSSFPLLMIYFSMLCIQVFWGQCGWVKAHEEGASSVLSCSKYATTISWKTAANASLKSLLLLFLASSLADSFWFLA